MVKILQHSQNKENKSLSLSNGGPKQREHRLNIGASDLDVGGSGRKLAPFIYCRQILLLTHIFH